MERGLPDGTDALAALCRALAALAAAALAEALAAAAFAAARRAASTRAFSAAARFATARRSRAADRAASCAARALASWASAWARVAEEMLCWRRAGFPCASVVGTADETAATSAACAGLGSFVSVMPSTAAVTPSSRTAPAPARSAVPREARRRWRMEAEREVLVVPVEPTSLVVLSLVEPMSLVVLSLVVRGRARNERGKREPFLGTPDARRAATIPGRGRTAATGAAVGVPP